MRTGISMKTALLIGATLAGALTTQASAQPSDQIVGSQCPGLRPESRGAFEAALKQSDEAQAQWARGDTTAIKKMWAKTDDVTLFGGLGGFFRGWDQVGQRLDWAATQFSPPASGDTAWQRELISVHVCDAISVVTQIERFTARSGPAKDERRVEVRVTLILRNDQDGWRIIHRHGDPLT